MKSANRKANSAASDPLLGTWVGGRYQVQERIGGGAMGAVYRASQPELGREVALKVMKPEAAFSEEAVARFRREAKAVSALTNPNTVRVFDFGTTSSGLLYLAMEMLEGEPITAMLGERGPGLSIKEATVYGRQILSSISEAHAKGLIHRDLKPDNVFLARSKTEREPAVKILDFGIAKAVEGDRKVDQFETQDGTVFGTPRYMSPEQAQGKPLDPRSDLYAVGVMLYEFLSGRPPFVDSDAVVVMAKHIREEPVPLRRANLQRAIPVRLERVVHKALRKNPLLRFSSAAEFEAALAACMPDVELLDRFTPSGLHTGLKTRILVLPRWQRAMLAVGTAAGVISAGVLATMLALGSWPHQQSGEDALGETTLASEKAAAQANPGQQRGHVPGAGLGSGVPTAESLNRDETSPGRPAAGSELGAGETAASAMSSVLLNTTPGGANVWHAGKLIGSTPTWVRVPEGQSKRIRVTKPGYRTQYADIAFDEKARAITLSSSGSSKGKSTRQSRDDKGESINAKKPESSPQEDPARGAAKSPDSPYEKFD